MRGQARVRYTLPAMAPTSRGTLLVETLSVGVPFVAFKAVFGVWCLGAGLAPVGGALLGLAALDLGLNLVNAGTLLARGRRVLPVCGLAWAAGERLGTALDTALAFGLVALAIGFGLLPSLEPRALHAWNWAVVVNVLGAGLSRLGSALAR